MFGYCPSKIEILIDFGENCGILDNLKKKYIMEGIWMLPSPLGGMIVCMDVSIALVGGMDGFIKCPASAF